MSISHENDVKFFEAPIKCIEAPNYWCLRNPEIIDSIICIHFCKFLTFCTVLGS